MANETDGRAAGSPSAVPDAANPGFRHGPPFDGRRPGPASSTTRYLCAAAYVSEEYADRVVEHLVADSHRAVSPALGYDTALVVRHCLRAQRLRLAQSAVVSVILTVGLCAFPAPGLLVFLICLVGSRMLRGSRRAAKGSIGRTVTVALVVMTGFSCLAPSFVAAFGTVAPREDPMLDANLFPVQATAILVTAYVAVTWARYRIITTIVVDLAHGRIPPAPEAVRWEIEQRLGVVAQAQAGNIVLHGDVEPFVGAGEQVDSWSVATELKATEYPEAIPSSGHYGAAGSRGHVVIDPVDLVRYLKCRLAELRSPALPESERITGLLLSDQIISSGTRWRGHPLVDDRLRLPFSHAEPEAVRMIIQHPQAGARHFLRATVGVMDEAGVGDDGHAIMPAERQSAIASTYIHVAAAGAMLYVEVVAFVLGPLEQRFLDIDGYDIRANSLRTAFREAACRFMGATVAAPLDLIRSSVRFTSMSGAIRRADQESRTKSVYDFGAVVDARQLASRTGFANNLQRLDSEKCRRIINRRVTEAIGEFLSDHGVDNSAFSRSVNLYQYNGVHIFGDNYGPVAAGDGASARATNTRIGGLDD
ncbi:hypothetical protein [Actinoplanes utahensis]|nr:hypothetical protein [Actinoplanes utahensis]